MPNAYEKAKTSSLWRAMLWSRAADFPEQRTALQIFDLKTPNAKEYADAFLGQNDYGEERAEIYFYPYSPKKTSLEQHGATEGNSEQLIADRYHGWRSEILAVDSIVSQHGKVLRVNDTPLRAYLAAIEQTQLPPDHRVWVDILDDHSLYFN